MHAYVRLRFESPVAQDVMIETWFRNYGEVYLNGTYVPRGKDVKRRGLQAHAALRKGPNELILMIENHGGDWRYRCRLLTLDNRALLSGVAPLHSQGIWD